ncbi:unnamed protein product [Closterium sp. NIES-53]
MSRFLDSGSAWRLVWAPVLVAVLVAVVAVLLTLILVFLARKQAAISCIVREVELCTAVLERAKRSKSETVANLSHELRTPIVGMLGWYTPIVGMLGWFTPIVGMLGWCTPIVGMLGWCTPIVGMLGWCQQHVMRRWVMFDLPLLPFLASHLLLPARHDGVITLERAAAAATVFKLVLFRPLPCPTPNHPHLTSSSPKDMMEALPLLSFPIPTTCTSTSPLPTRHDGGTTGERAGGRVAPGPGNSQGVCSGHHGATQLGARPRQAARRLPLPRDSPALPAPLC